MFMLNYKTFDNLMLGKTVFSFPLIRGLQLIVIAHDDNGNNSNNSNLLYSFINNAITVHINILTIRLINNSMNNCKGNAKS